MGDMLDYIASNRRMENFGKPDIVRTRNVFKKDRGCNLEIYYFSVV